MVKRASTDPLRIVASRLAWLIEPVQLTDAARLLIVLSLLDLLMTYVLLRQGHLGFYEANPIARWWFVRWNIKGMIAFKFGVIAIVVAICEIVERQRPGWGRAILWLGSLAAGVAVLRGLQLFLGHGVTTS